MDVANIEIVRCGTCAGCELERQRDALIKRLDEEMFAPQFEALARRIAVTGCRADREHPEYDAVMRDRRALIEHRSRVIDDIARQYMAAGCYQFTIRIAGGP